MVVNSNKFTFRFSLFLGLFLVQILYFRAFSGFFMMILSFTISFNPYTIKY